MQRSRERERTTDRGQSPEVDKTYRGGAAAKIRNMLTIPPFIAKIIIMETNNEPLDVSFTCLKAILIHESEKEITRDSSDEGCRDFINVCFVIYLGKIDAAVSIVATRQTESCKVDRDVYKYNDGFIARNL